MSSGFVSGGTIDNPIERDDEWLKAQQEIEVNRRRKEEEGRQVDGKSLFEVLQQNKATKQDAFEESIRLKNQFRTLDDDEIEFLDSVLESTRAQEEMVKKQTTEQLEIFRKQQEEADKAILLESSKGETARASTGSGSPLLDESEWAVSARKRKRVKEKELLKGVKSRKLSTSTGSPQATERGSLNANTQVTEEDQSESTQRNISTPEQANGRVQPDGRAEPDSGSRTLPLSQAGAKGNPLGKPQVTANLVSYSTDEDD